jgi:hypothetical protein
MLKCRKYEIVLTNSEVQLTKEENQKKNSVYSIADCVERSVPTVLQCWSRWFHEGVHDRHRGSRVLHTSWDHEEHPLRTLAIRDKLNTIGNEWSEVPSSTPNLHVIPISPNKVFWTAFLPSILCPPLTPIHCVRKLNCRNERINWEQGMPSNGIQCRVLFLFVSPRLPKEGETYAWRLEKSEFYVERHIVFTQHARTFRSW